MPISSAEELIEDIRLGKMVILMDDEDRENEGDILIAADKVTPEIINFMATHGRGLICLTLTRERCQQLNLPQMVHNNTEAFGTAFTVSIEAARGVDTGISASDRCTTILAATAKNAGPEDLVMPGHIFPVMAQEGGVLSRAGHTEAGCDIARLAGHSPSSVIIEVLNEDGTMARRPQLEVFAEKHDIKLGTIADLIEYRHSNETTIEKIAESPIDTEFGEFTLRSYTDIVTGNIHYALIKGDIDPDGATLVRVHSQDPFKDLLHSGNSHWTLRASMERISQEGGVLVVLSEKEQQEATIAKLKIMAGEAMAPIKQHERKQFIQVGLGSQILADIGVHKMRLLTSTTTRYHALSGFGLEVVENICE